MAKTCCGYVSVWRNESLFVDGRAMHGEGAHFARRSGVGGCIRAHSQTTTMVISTHVYGRFRFDISYVTCSIYESAEHIVRSHDKTKYIKRCLFLSLHIHVYVCIFASHEPFGWRPMVGGIPAACIGAGDWGNEHANKQTHATHKRTQNTSRFPNALAPTGSAQCLGFLLATSDALLHI